MKEETPARAGTQATEHDVVKGTFYTLNLLVALISGAAGFAMPLAWLITGFCVFSMLIGHQAEEAKSDREEAKGSPLDVEDRATGCGTSLVLAGVLVSAFVAALLALAGRLP